MPYTPESGWSSGPDYNYNYNNTASGQIGQAGSSQQPVEEIDLNEQQLPMGNGSNPPPNNSDSWLYKQLLRVPVVGPTLETINSINLPFIDKLLQHVNRDLLVSKMFYFFFYSAFGSLFPLMGVYFKQMGMNPSQVGVLTGTRPFIEIFSAPFWNSLAERFQKSKALLIFSLMSWIVFTYSLAHIRPPASACVAFNDTDYVLYIPYSTDELSQPDASADLSDPTDISNKESNSSSSNELFISAPPPPLSVPLQTTTMAEPEAEVQIDDTSGNNEQQTSRRKRRFAISKLLLDSSLANLEDDYVDEELHSSDDMTMVGLAGGSSTNVRKLKRRNADPSPDSGGNTEIAATVEESGNTGEPPAAKQLEQSQSTVNSSGEEQPKKKRKFKHRHKTPPTHIVGKSPITVEYTANYNKEKHSSFVTPPFSTIVYKIDDIKEVFFLLLLLIGLGEFFSAPAITLADSATLAYLGENTDLYGRQRMFGSLSWAVTLLFVGMALDNATSIPDHPCGPHERERSYIVCFTIFALLMACALLTATQFRFTYHSTGAGGTRTQVDGSGSATTMVNSEGTPRSIFNQAPPINKPNSGGTQQLTTSITNSGVATASKEQKEKFEFLDRWKSAVFAQRTRELPEWVNVFRQFKNTLHLTYLFITWFLGCGVGLVFTFLFWHLQDVGGTPTLFGICSVINHISEILAYFFSFGFIKRFGHTKVLSFGLACNVVRFIYISFLDDPWYALPFELVQGITHAACFAACCSYISHASRPELRSSTQGVMQGLHHGIGRACGALLGGLFINAFGSRAAFAIYGLLSGCVLAGFLYVRRAASAGLLDDEPEVQVDSNEAIGGYGAPQGVPSATPVKISHAISHQDVQHSMGTTNVTSAAPQLGANDTFDFNAVWND